MSSEKTHFVGVNAIVLYSLTAWPLLIGMKIHPILSEPFPLLIFGALTLCFHFMFFRWLLPPKKDALEGNTNPNIVPRGMLYYCCCVFTWSCMIDLIFYLELEGCVEGYMDFYLKNGESYFESSYGSMSLLFDFLLNMLLYLTIAFLIDNKMDCRDIVTMWGAIMTVSLATLQHGAFAGKWSTDIKPSTLMNIPYVIAPLYFMVQFCQKKRFFIGDVIRKKSTKLKIFDVIVVLISIDQFVFNLLRAHAAMGSPSNLPTAYIRNFEPYLNEPTKFGAGWPIFSLYATTPMQFLICYGLFHPGCEWTLDLSVMNVAMSVYGSSLHLLSQFHWRNPDPYRIPTESDRHLTVIVLNLIGPVMAVATCYRCFTNEGFFMSDDRRVGKNKKSQ